MKSVAKAFGIAASLLMTGTAGVHAQSMDAECYERANLLHALAADQGERLAQTRRVGSTGLLEAFKSPSDGTWTIVYSNDDQMSCVLAAGDGLQPDDDDDDDTPDSDDLTI
jgi:hypothetical protein